MRPTIIFSAATRFHLLLAGAFFLEISGYLAFPYLSLQLRERFGIAPIDIGHILMIAIWIRPLAALAGGLLSTRLRPLTIFAFACLAEGACFLLLGMSSGASWAIFAVLIGNVGFSIWKPNIFALAYREDDTGSSATRIALLNGILNAGAACGSLISAAMIRFNISTVFLASGILYPLLIPFFIPSLSTEGPAAEESDVPPHESSFRGQFLSLLFQWRTLALILMTVGFWASYNQFNSFFSLFANDWLRDPSWTGTAFACVTVIVALSSMALARWRTLSLRIRELSAVSLVAIAIGWIFLTSSHNVPAVLVFLASIAVGETLLSVFLADSWGGLARGKKHLMQSLNFSARSFGMGIGGLLGGWTYIAPAQAGPLSRWGMQNVALLAIALIGVFIFKVPSSEAKS